MKRSSLFYVLVVLVLFLKPASAIEIEDITESGTYFVTIRAEDEQGVISEKEVRMLITSRNTVVNTRVHEAIDGVDLRYYDDAFFEYDINELIDLGRVRAWDTNTGAKIPVTSFEIVKTNTFKSKITFRTQAGTTITLNGYRTGKGGLNLEKGYYKPISQKNYNLPKTIQILSVLVFVPLITTFFSFLRTKKEYNQVVDTLFKRIRKEHDRHDI